MRSTLNVRRSSRRWSYAARYQRPEWTTSPCAAQLAPRLVARERAVRPANSASPPDRRRRGGGRCCPAPAPAPARTRGEVERRLERLDLTPEPVGQDAVDLHERALGRLRRPGQPEASRRLDPERDRDGLVVREHERRQAVARAGSGTRRRRRAGPRPECRGPAAPRRSGARCAGRSRAGRRSRGP